MDTGTATGADETATTGTVDPCSAYAEHLSADCIGDAKTFDGYYMYCADNIAYGETISEDCGAILEAIFACLAVTDCETVLRGQPCPEETAIFDKVCDAQ